MRGTGKAVFLSYASQDAEAAKKICDALRAAGVEVWFDQSELRGGDAWDQKIKRQIRECTLFMPVISANTNARAEGYFRLEWKLAVDRSHLMADDAPFLFPVIIDEMADAAARVPDRFRDVQWTRLGAKDTPESLAGRVVKLLAGEVAPASSPARSQNAGGTPALPQNRTTPWVRNAAALGGILISVYYAVFAPWSSKRRAEPKPAAPTTTATPAPAAAFPRDPDLRRAWNLVLVAYNATAEEFALAEDLVKGVIARRPTDPEAVIVYAWINDAYLNRGFDNSEERYVLGRRYAERAVQLASDEPEALAALGQFLSFRRADLPRAEELLRRAIELKPREPRFYRALSYNVLSLARPEEGLQFAERAAELFPTEPLVLYELGLHYRNAGRIDDMERAFDRSLALAPIAGAMIWKAWTACWMHGDVAGMKPWLDRLPAGSRLNDRALILRYQFACLSQQPAELADALQALRSFPGAVLRDFYYTGPKALPIGDLFAAQGKPELAKVQYDMALAELARDKASAPADLNILTAELWTLLGLGRRDEALADVRLVLSSAPPNSQAPFVRWWFDTTPACLLLGARELALPQIKLAAGRDAVRAQLRTALRVDPRMAPFRDDKEIAALLAEPAK